MTTLPTPAPKVVPDTAAFWAATAEHRLEVPYCRTCGEAVWYPRGHCPNCYSTDLESRPMSGRGSVYTFSIVRRGEGPYAEVTPYVIAYVELEEGPRIATNIVGIDPEQVEVGMAVEAVFEDTGEGTALVRFAPR